MLVSVGSVLPPAEVDELGVLVEGVGQAGEGHVEGAVPGDHLGLGGRHHPGQLPDLGLGGLAHVGGLVELPDLGLGDLVGGVRDDGVGHVGVGLVVAEVLVGELVLDEQVQLVERVDGALPLQQHAVAEEHQPAAGVEVADGQFPEEQVAEAPAQDSLLDVPVAVDRVVTFPGQVLVDEVGAVVDERAVLDGAEGTWATSCWALELRVRKFSLFLRR